MRPGSENRRLETTIRTRGYGARLVPRGPGCKRHHPGHAPPKHQRQTDCLRLALGFSWLIFGSLAPVAIAPAAPAARANAFRREMVVSLMGPFYWAWSATRLRREDGRGLNVATVRVPPALRAPGAHDFAAGFAVSEGLGEWRVRIVPPIRAATRRAKAGKAHEHRPTPATRRYHFCAQAGDTIPSNCSLGKVAMTPTRSPDRP